MLRMSNLATKSYVITNNAFIIQIYEQNTRPDQIYRIVLLVTKYKDEKSLFYQPHFTKNKVTKCKGKDDKRDIGFL